MGKKTTPAEALAKISHSKDTDKMKGSISFRMPIWLYRHALRGGKTLRLDDVAATFRAMTYLGAELVASGEVQMITEDIESASDGNTTRGVGPARGPRGERIDPLTPVEVLRAASDADILDEMARRRPGVVVTDGAELSAKVADLLKRQAESATPESIRKSLGL